MKSRQFCSVCKQWLEMEVVPTGDGDEDDGVIWFRCPQCQGFLPKLSGDLGGPTVAPGEAASTPVEDDMPWDSPADMMAARKAKASAFLPEEEDDDLADEEVDELAADVLLGDVLLADVLEGDLAIDEVPDLDDGHTDARREPAHWKKKSEERPPPSEPLHEYAAMLAALDASAATPYRPWETYAVGECVHHLAWEECGVVVAKESLPGGRKVIKCYFEAVGVVRLIEQAPQ
jgi:hypothetical protein